MRTDEPRPTAGSGSVCGWSTLSRSRCRSPQSEAAADEDLLVAASVQVDEGARELDLLAVERDRSPGAPAFLARGRQQVFDVHRREPAHPRMPVFEVTGGLRVHRKVYGILLEFAENEVRHVEEVHADFRGDAARLVQVALSILQVPVAARGSVGKGDLMLRLPPGGLHPLAQRHDRRMQTQLQDGVHSAAPILLNLRQAVDVPRVEGQGRRSTRNPHICRGSPAAACRCGGGGSADRRRMITAGCLCTQRPAPRPS